MEDDQWIFNLADKVEHGSKITVQRMGSHWTTSMTAPRRARLAALIRLALSIPESEIKPVQQAG